MYYKYTITRYSPTPYVTGQACVSLSCDENEFVPCAVMEVRRTRVILEYVSR